MCCLCKNPMNMYGGKKTNLQVFSKSQSVNFTIRPLNTPLPLPSKMYFG
jgi:hypothetical protein